MEASEISNNSEGIYSELVVPDHDVYITLEQNSYTDISGPQCSELTEKGGKCSLAASYHGLLCALVLTAITALCVHYASLSKNYSSMEKDLEELKMIMPEVKNQIQEDYKVVIQELRRQQMNVYGQCPQGWEQFNSRCYFFSSESKSWKDSRIDCLKQGADLVIIESAEEQEFISNHTKDNFYWIGLSDSDKEGTWLWVDRTPLEKGFWRTGEPDNHYESLSQRYPNTDCAASVSGENPWVDLPCYFSEKYTCESEGQ